MLLEPPRGADFPTPTPTTPTHLLLKQVHYETGRNEDMSSALLSHIRINELLTCQKRFRMLFIGRAVLQRALPARLRRQILLFNVVFKEHLHLSQQNSISRKDCQR